MPCTNVDNLAVNEKNVKKYLHLQKGKQNNILPFRVVKDFVDFFQVLIYTILGIYFNQAILELKT